jgi:hypothetical protein
MGELEILVLKIAKIAHKNKVAYQITVNGEGKILNGDIFASIYTLKSDDNGNYTTIDTSRLDGIRV